MRVTVSDDNTSWVSVYRVNEWCTEFQGEYTTRTNSSEIIRNSSTKLPSGPRSFNLNLIKLWNETAMYNLNLTSEQLEFRETIQSFAQKKVKPAAIHPDRLEPFAKPLLVDLLDEASQLGIRTFTLSEELGGVGTDLLTACIVFEELAAGDVDIAVTLAQTAGLGRFLFDRIVPKQVSQKFLPHFIEDDQFHLALAASWDGNLNGWKYRRSKPGEQLNLPVATKEDDDWILNGSISGVVNAPVAKLIAVEAITSPNANGNAGRSLFLIPRGAQGLSVETPLGSIAEKTTDGEDGVNWQHGTASSCNLDHCNIPEEFRIDIDDNYLSAQYQLEMSMLTKFSAINLGIATAAMNQAIDYAKIRYQGGRYIIEHQAIGEKISDMHIKLELARNLIWKAAWAADNSSAIAEGSLPDLPYHIMAQVNTAEAVNEIALKSAEIFGAMGVMRDMPLQKYVHDSFMFLNSATQDCATKLLVSEAAVDFEKR